MEETAKTIMDEVMVVNNAKRKAALGPERRAIASAAEQRNSPGANDWLTARPRNRRQAFADDEYALLVRWRFRLPLTEGDQRCGYTRSTTGVRCPSVVDPHLDHAMGCARAPIVARHNAIRDWLAGIARESGACTQTEQRIECLARTPCPKSDVRIQMPVYAHALHLDVEMSHPFKMMRTGAYAAMTGPALLAKEVCKKREHYAAGIGGKPVTLIPIVACSYGRWNDDTNRFLKAMAKARSLQLANSLGVDAGKAKAAIIQKWRLEFSCLLQRGNAKVIRAAFPSPTEFTAVRALCEAAVYLAKAAAAGTWEK